ncbi:MAG TPA: PP2C family protein-serine/threonine phosphatase [Terriglobales bacterium]|nr:PP2C family protein-serine/threonine phosphatase [Terriglobales bacterium]
MSLDPYLAFRVKLTQLGWPPRTRVGKLAFFVLGLAIALFALQKILVLSGLSAGSSLSGWVSFLAFAAFVLFSGLTFRWLRRQLLWRLRNRLIVSYIFIGVIPLILLLTLSVTAFYLFAGQFATFIVTSGVQSELKTLHAANSAIAHELSAQTLRGNLSESNQLQGLRQTDTNWSNRQVTAWAGRKMMVNAVPVGSRAEPLQVPSFLKPPFEDVVRDQGKIYLRCVDIVSVQGISLAVVSSEPFDQSLLEQLASDLGEITLYTSGFSIRNVDSGEKSADSNTGIRVRKPGGDYVLETDTGTPLPTYTAGTVPSANGALDRKVTFATSIFVVDWNSGDSNSPAAMSVQTRLSMLYRRLFAALGDFAPAIEFVLVAMAIIFAVIELAALIIGVGLSRTITGSIASLYRATERVNRGDLSHRIPVKSDDQLAALETSFNSMTASLERLLLEQKEKQRLENELAIAQEVQAQLFPKEISQLESLEVHGFCRPARTVSGDYYDFLALDAHKLTLAVGDISGKGISAALLMATIHSAVRAYSLETIPAQGLPAAVGVAAGGGLMMASGQLGGDLSPGAMLSLLNHQLYESTPTEKYATLFLGVYDGSSRTLTYSNGGHLPPVILHDDGSTSRLEAGGMVVGLFDNLSFDEGSIQLKPGDIFLAYSDGVTEPENDFGEFGEQRLIDLVRENQHLPLVRISEIVSTAVYDWIGANEQPDDITLVLARAR